MTQPHDTPTSIDLNADLGEDPAAVASGHDDAIAAAVSSLNVACGGHAGDDATMAHFAELALARGGSLALGAHPGYPDRANFGRVSMPMPRPALEDTIARQIERLCRIAERVGVRLRHVKPHGALYHDAMSSCAVAKTIAAACARVDPWLALVGQPDRPGYAAWQDAGIAVIAEGFADRAYRPDGTLIPRDQPGALLHDPTQAAAQAVALARSGRFASLCIHADTPGSATTARAVRAALEAAGIVIRPVTDQRPRS